jgi:hypothetical protein
MSTGQKLRLRGFIEGIEVPIISASLAIQPDSPAQCQVQIPATDKAHEFLPRSLIHIFFYDYFEGPGETTGVTIQEEQVSPSDEAVRQVLEQDFGESELEGLTDANLPTNQVGTNAAPIHINEISEGMDVDIGPAVSVTHYEEDLKWKKYFSGEIIGYQFVKTSRSRAIILSCMDESLYWDTCYQYQVDVSSLHGDAAAHFIGAGTTMFDVFFEGETATMIDIVMRNCASQPELKGLLSGIVHLLEHAGGVYTSNGFRGVNDFQSLAELRLKLVRMITASEVDESSRRLFPRRAFNAWTSREGGRLGKIASFREMLNLLNRFIFHNTFPCPIAKYIPVETRTNTRRYPLGATAQGGQATALLRRAISTVQNIITKCNTRDSNLVIDEVGISSDIRELDRAIVNINTILSTISANAAMAKVREAQQALRGRGLSYEAMSTVSKLNIVSTKLDEAIQALGMESQVRSTTTQTHSRINSQIIRPDIFMVSPPRCNILFPDLYNSINYSRTYMREVTRMKLTVSDELFGPDELLDNYYYSPEIEVLGERTQRARGGGTEGATLKNAAYTSRLMDHELYVGIIPVFERMNEVNIVAASSNEVNIRGARVPFVTRAANFQFFKNRFSPRALSVSGKFNPWAVAGFPAVVIDKYMTVEQIVMSGLRNMELIEALTTSGWSFDHQNSPYWNFQSENIPDVWLALRETVPTQFVGLLVNLNHDVNQDSATTSYVFTTARTHREKDELMNSNEMVLSRRESGQARRRTVVAALEGNPPLIGQLGPYYGRIQEVHRLTVSGSYHLFGTFRADLPLRARRKVPVNVTQAAREYGAEVVTIVGDLNREVTFYPYEIFEEVDRWRGQRVDIPMEDFLRPPWMSEVWANDRIGMTYQQFFGTGSITDPIVINTGFATSAESSDNALTSSEATARNENINDPTQSSSQTTQSAEMAINVEKAIDLLVRIYSLIRHQAGGDVNEFIRAYTWRPVATLIDMLGSRNLNIDPRTGRVIEGFEGIHSRAFGRGEMGSNLRNLIPDVDTEEVQHVKRILGISTREGADRRNLLVRLDKRAEKADRVLAYVEELSKNRGILG